ncbi:hypothetical protein I4F81_000090 [Pyropia yezoensis]|uniref:Uncharacterized protein n=1 Tax=Pyropia yezoensis TaxID=2788 RepID=A0ACC3BIL4_PYRYE|nr:hypothetical protein I4F81_000090 [Neopyropia yezoensis]
MKLDATALRYLEAADFRALTAIEMGMRNHELVPTPLIASLAGLRGGNVARCLSTLHRHSLVHRDRTRYEGYRLTTLGYDYLAMHALQRRGALLAVGRTIGVGKEADVLVHRLGRTSFRAVKSKRDYLRPRQSAGSWMYLSRLAAVREFAFLSALYARGFPVPVPIAASRHIVVMELVPGTPLHQVRDFDGGVAAAATAGRALIQFCADLAAAGLVHCDLNEHNVMVGPDRGDGGAPAAITVIDFPQVVSVGHRYGNSPDDDGLGEEGVAAGGGAMAASTSTCRGPAPADADHAPTATGARTRRQRQRPAAADAPAASAADRDAVGGDAGAEGAVDGVAGVDDGDDAGTSLGAGAAAPHRPPRSAAAPWTRVDAAAVAARVRSERGRRARRAGAKRNVVKNSDARKLKAELSGKSIWN